MPTPSPARVGQRFLASQKTGRRNNRALVKAILAVLEKIRADGAELGPDWGKGGKYDPVTDTGVWVGDEIRRYVGKDSSADVVLHYDGAGYDYLNYNSPIRKYRAAIQSVAGRLDYLMEDINGWSTGFYYEG